MSVSQVPLHPLRRGSLLKLWLGIVLLVAAALLLAWNGAGALRGETTDSGLVFRTVKAGEGPLITANDAVLLEYVGTYDDGTVFDGTQGRPVPMSPGTTVPGFAEAMQKMQKGGHYKFRMPPELAYGSTPPQGLKAGEALNFEVQVVEVAQGMGAMVGQTPSSSQPGL